MIELDQISKSFGEVRALDGVSFRAENGRITGLLGPNGAGKTTALRILYTVLAQDSGRALVDGFDTLDAPREVQGRIGVLPDAHGLYPRLTSRENVRSPCSTKLGHPVRFPVLLAGARRAAIARRWLVGSPNPIIH